MYEETYLQSLGTHEPCPFEPQMLEGAFSFCVKSGALNFNGIFIQNEISLCRF
jgi:hypothetical protein